MRFVSAEELVAYATMIKKIQVVLHSRPKALKASVLQVLDLSEAQEQI